MHEPPRSRKRSALATASRAAGHRALDLLLPPGCVSCRSDLSENPQGIPLCERCRAGFCNLRHPICERCGCELPQSFPDDQPECDNCRQHRLHFSHVYALGAYRDPTRNAVLQMKHPGAHPLAAALGQLLFERHRPNLEELAPGVVVPVPMHWARRMRRGANGPETVAEYLARRLQAPFAARLLRRRKRTQRQADLPPGNRFRNVRQAFRLDESYSLEGVCVLLVDDVLTTGATCSEAAHVLLEAGASQVAVAVVARAAPWK